MSFFGNLLGHNKPAAETAPTVPPATGAEAQINEISQSATEATFALPIDNGNSTVPTAPAANEAIIQPEVVAPEAATTAALGELAIAREPAEQPLESTDAAAPAAEAEEVPAAPEGWSFGSTEPPVAPTAEAVSAETPSTPEPVVVAAEQVRVTALEHPQAQGAADSVATPSTTQA